MGATTYTDVPARRYSARHGVRATKAWRRILGEIERCLKAGGVVEMDQRRAATPIIHGGDVEYVTVRLDWPEAAQ